MIRRQRKSQRTKKKEIQESEREVDDGIGVKKKRSGRKWESLFIDEDNYHQEGDKQEEEQTDEEQEEGQTFDSEEDEEIDNYMEEIKADAHDKQC
jgi:hypothetical protein